MSRDGLADANGHNGLTRNALEHEDEQATDFAVPSGGQWRVYSHNTSGMPRLYAHDDDESRRRRREVAATVVRGWKEDPRRAARHQALTLEEALAALDDPAVQDLIDTGVNEKAN